MARKRQTATTDGSNNIIVQASGENISVAVGQMLPYLTLTRHFGRHHIDSEADLLSPFTLSIPLT